MRVGLLVMSAGVLASAVPVAGCGAQQPDAASVRDRVATVPSGGAVASSSVPVALRPTASSRRTLAVARRACRGKEPGRVVEAFLPAARRRGAPRSLVVAASHPSRQVTKGTGYALLAGAVYAWSLPKSQLTDGANGCSYELRKAIENTSMKGSSR
jgi:hypothetical protein